MTRRGFFSKLFGTAAAAAAAGAAGASILARGSSGAPADVRTTDTLGQIKIPPPPFGVPQLAPMEFYDYGERAPRLTITGVDLSKKTVTLGGFPVFTDPAVPRSSIEFYSAAAAAGSLWPERARIVNIQPPAPTQDPGDWRTGLYTFSPPAAVYGDPGADVGLTATAAAARYRGAVDAVLTDPGAAFERGRRARARYIDRSLRESFWRG